MYYCCQSLSVLQAHRGGSTSNRPFDPLEVLRAVQQGRRSTDILHLVVEQATRAVDADRGSLWLESKPAGEFHLAASFGLKAETSARWKRELLATRYGTLSRRVAADLQPLLVPDAETATLGPGHPVGCFGDQALLAVPVVAGGRCLGALVLSRLTPGRAFSQDDGMFVATLAAQAGLVCYLPGGAAATTTEAQAFSPPEQSNELAERFAEVVRDSESLDLLIEGLVISLADVAAAEGYWLLSWDPGEQQYTVLSAATRGKWKLRAPAGTIIKPATPAEELLGKGEAFTPAFVEQVKAALFPHGAADVLGAELTDAALLLFARQPVGLVLLARSEKEGARPLAVSSALLAALAEAIWGRQELERNRRQHTQLFALLDGLPDGVLAVDSQDRVVIYNARAQALLGRRAAEVFGQRFSTVLSHLVSGAANAETFLFEFTRAITAPDSAPVLHLELVNPEPRSLSVRLFAVQGEAQQRLGWGAVIRESLTGDGASDLRLEALANAAQELRMPLATIKGCTATLLSGNSRWDEETVREFLSIVDTECDRLHGLVESVFDASRLTCGVGAIRLQSCSIREVLNAVLDQMKWISQPVEVQVPEDLPQVVADPARLEELLRHLLANAAKFSPADSPIQVRAAVVESEIWVTVTDRGIGIPPEFRERVFERFFCVGSPASKPAEGIGLGLAIARSIVESHRGRIWVESVPGQGSAFTFTLPVGVPSRPRPRRSTGPAGGRQVSERREEGPTRPRLGRIARRPSVLVVDDETRVLRFIRANLEAGGYRVLVGTEGATALRLVESEEPDLVLLDIMLPDVDGFEVVQRIRQFSVVPIILITGRTDEADRVRGLNLGADDYLAKPFSSEELMARVGAVMRRTRFFDELEPRPTLLCGDLAINFAQRKVTRRGVEVKLSPTEYKLLYELAVNAGRILSHEDLLQRVWGPQYRSESAYLWTYVRHLRRKLEEKPEEPKYILTEPGVGYTFALPG